MTSKGVQAEQWAAHYLQIDLIMQDGDTLVFVEVRLRSNPAFGGAAGSIDKHKQQRIIRTAQHYLTTLPRIPPCRFDALLLEDELGKKAQWLKNAFGI
jgi:putative endonuclease